MRRIAFALALILGLAPATAPRADGPVMNVPVVIELFTSQGCSACPPADALLAELATRDDVIPLALHVDYWDYIGWEDTFASRQFTRRQYAYARAAGRRMVYTPQMIVGGGEHVVGSETMRVADLIMTQREVEYPVHVRLSREGSVLNIEAEATMAMPDDAMVVQVVRYDPTATVEIRRGENAGRTFTYTNIVTEWSQVGTWTGEEPYRLSLTDASDTPVVVIVQEAGPGLILGAARLE